MDRNLTRWNESRSSDPLGQDEKKRRRSERPEPLRTISLWLRQARRIDILSAGWTSRARAQAIGTLDGKRPHAKLDAHAMGGKRTIQGIIAVSHASRICIEEGRETHLVADCFCIELHRESDEHCSLRRGADRFSLLARFSLKELAVEI